MGLLSLTMSSSRPIPCTLLVTFLLISLSSVSIQDDTIYDEIEDPDAPEEIKTLQTETGLSIAQAFRCGIFIVNPADDNGLPLTDLKVFPALFDAKDECEAEKPNVKRYNDYCNGIMEKIKKKRKLKLSDPSTFKKSREEGNMIGDDICWKIKKDVKAPFVGGKRSRRFPKGLQFGLYSNSCNETMWHFTGQKHDETICCGRAKLIDCPSGI